MFAMMQGIFTEECLAVEY